jgi:hypothetical protein
MVHAWSELAASKREQRTPASGTQPLPAKRPQTGDAICKKKKKGDKRLVHRHEGGGAGEGEQRTHARTHARTPRLTCPPIA